LTLLAHEGCDAVQGDLIGKPLPIGQYAALVGRCHGAGAQDRLGVASFVASAHDADKCEAIFRKDHAQNRI